MRPNAEKEFIKVLKELDIDKLKSMEDFPMWKSQIERIFKRFECEKILDGDYDENEYTMNLVKEAAWFLEHSMESKIWRRFMSQTDNVDWENPNKIWKWVSSTFAMDDRILVKLYLEMLEMKFFPGKFEEFHDMFLKKLNILNESKISMSEAMKVSILLHALPQRYSRLKNKIEKKSFVTIIGVRH